MMANPLSENSTPPPPRARLIRETTAAIAVALWGGQSQSPTPRYLHSSIRILQGSFVQKVLIHPVGLFVCVYGLYGREEPLCVGACQMHNTDIVKCLRVGLGALFSGSAS